jgi:hypothetical protein
MYVGNCCDCWLCDCQLTTLYGKVAAKLRVSCNDVSMAPISTRAQYTADPRSQSNGTLQQGANFEFSGDSRGLMGMGVVHERPWRHHFACSVVKRLPFGKSIHGLYFVLGSLDESRCH